ncbi:g1685 [Coccomyxa elongata]
MAPRGDTSPAHPPGPRVHHVAAPNAEGRRRGLLLLLLRLAVLILLLLLRRTAAWPPGPGPCSHGRGGPAASLSAAIRKPDGVGLAIKRSLSRRWVSETAPASDMDEDTGSQTAQPHICRLLPLELSGIPSTGIEESQNWLAGHTHFDPAQTQQPLCLLTHSADSLPRDSYGLPPLIAVDLADLAADAERAAAPARQGQRPDVPPGFEPRATASILAQHAPQVALTGLTAVRRSGPEEPNGLRCNRSGPALWCHYTSHSRGVSILSRTTARTSNLTVRHSSATGRTLSVEFTFSGLPYTVVCVYAPSVAAERQHYFTQELLPHIPADRHLLVGGDSAARPDRWLISEHLRVSEEPEATGHVIGYPGDHVGVSPSLTAPAITLYALLGPGNSTRASLKVLEADGRAAMAAYIRSPSAVTLLLWQDAHQLLQALNAEAANGATLYAGVVWQTARARVVLDAPAGQDHGGAVLRDYYSGDAATILFAAHPVSEVAQGIPSQLQAHQAAEDPSPVEPGWLYRSPAWLSAQGRAALDARHQHIEQLSRSLLFSTFEASRLQAPPRVRKAAAEGTLTQVLGRRPRGEPDPSSYAAWMSPSPDRKLPRRDRLQLQLRRAARIQQRVSIPDTTDAAAASAELPPSGAHETGAGACVDQAQSAGAVAARILSSSRKALLGDWRLATVTIRQTAGVLSDWLRGRDPKLTREEFRERWCHRDVLCVLGAEPDAQLLIHWSAHHPVPLPA